MPVVADHCTSAGRGEPVPGEHRRQRRTASRARGGGNVQVGGAEPDRHRHGGSVQLRRDGVPVPAERDEGLGGHSPLHSEQGRERFGRDRAQRLGPGEGGDRATAVLGGPQPGVPSDGAPSLEPGLCFLDRDIVGQGPPEPLRGNVVGLLHDALAVPAPRRTRLHGHAVVLRDGRERRRHLPGRRGHDGAHPVEAPVLRQAPEGEGDPVEPARALGSLWSLSGPPGTVRTGSLLAAHGSCR